MGGKSEKQPISLRECRLSGSEINSHFYPEYRSLGSERKKGSNIQVHILQMCMIVPYYMLC